jgi:hypothetical protein
VLRRDKTGPKWRSYFADGKRTTDTFGSATKPCVTGGRKPLVSLSSSRGWWKRLQADWRRSESCGIETIAKKWRTRQDVWLVPDRSCNVSFWGVSVVRGSVELDAESVYDAAIRGLALLRRDGWVDSMGPATELEVGCGSRPRGTRFRSSNCGPTHSVCGAEASKGTM